MPVKAFEEIPVYGGIDYRREVLVQAADKQRNKRRSLLQILDDFGVGLKHSVFRLLKSKEDKNSVSTSEEDSVEPM